MSHVTDIVLILGGNDTEERMADVNEWLTTGNPFGHPTGHAKNHGDMTRVSQYAGGPKAAQLDVYQGAFSYFESVNVFLDFLLSLPWDDPATVLVVWQDEHDETPTSVRLSRKDEIEQIKAEARFDWDWWHNADGSYREHTPEEWAKYHYGKDWKAHLDLLNDTTL